MIKSTTAAIMSDASSQIETIQSSQAERIYPNPVRDKLIIRSTETFRKPER